MSLTEGEKERNRGMRRVSAGVSEEWKAEALTKLFYVACERAQFTADDVWDRGCAKPDEPRAMGPIFMRAKSLGWIVPTENFAASRYTTQHARPIRVWKSLVIAS